MSTTAPRPRLIEQIGVGAELVVWGDADREDLARRVLAHRDAVTARGLAMMRGFLNDTFRPEAFEVVTIEVHPAATSEQGEFSVDYHYSPTEDPEQFGYIVFTVSFTLSGPPDTPWWPFRMSIGFC